MYVITLLTFQHSLFELTIENSNHVLCLCKVHWNGDRTSTGSVNVENSGRGFIVILACTVVDKVIILFTNFHVEKDFTVEFSEKFTV